MCVCCILICSCVVYSAQEYTALCVSSDPYAVSTAVRSSIIMLFSSLPPLKRSESLVDRGVRELRVRSRTNKRKSRQMSVVDTGGRTEEGYGWRAAGEQVLADGIKESEWQQDLNPALIKNQTVSD